MNIEEIERRFENAKHCLDNLTDRPAGNVSIDLKITNSEIAVTIHFMKRNSSLGIYVDEYSEEELNGCTQRDIGEEVESVLYLFSHEFIDYMLSGYIQEESIEWDKEFSHGEKAIRYNRFIKDRYMEVIHLSAVLNEFYNELEKEFS